MSELNAEQIKKALECCKTPLASDCENCSYTGKRLEDGVYEGCVNCLVGDALSLINSQEQRIKELAKEYESMANSVNEASKLIRKSRADKEYWENRARESESEYDQAVKRGYNLGTVDSVRSFAERLIKHFDESEAFTEMESDYIALEIDRIAKELLEESE